MQSRRGNSLHVNDEQVTAEVLWPLEVCQPILEQELIFLLAKYSFKPQAEYRVKYAAVSRPLHSLRGSELSRCSLVHRYRLDKNMPTVSPSRVQFAETSS